MRLYFVLVLCLCSVLAFAGNVDTVSIYSAAMKKAYKCVVITPEKKKTAYPVVYLLHGYGGNYANWIARVPQLAAHADTYGMIIVCPDGAFGSWYFDSPVDSLKRFETYVGKEIPAYIDAHYPTIKDRKGRAITGLSMGGHGGLFLGFRHADYFSACGSMSGALMIDRITRGFGMDKVLGDTLKNRSYYENLSAMKEMEHYGKGAKDSLAIIIDCGIDDFIIEMSRAAHQKMLALKIPHDYTERPGRHDWPYWSNAVQYQLLYFKNHFERMNR